MRLQVLDTGGCVAYPGGEVEGMTCAFCGKKDPVGGLHHVAQISNPVTYVPGCKRQLPCYWRVLCNIVRRVRAGIIGS